MTIAQLVNHRNPHVAMLALALLDTLVQTCGYPFHLQISTKEFLNELVRRFPERPPPYPGPVMSRILELIHGWKEGICTDSRWKDDLGNIRDMHRLLTFKGYRFREMPRPQSATATAVTSVSTDVLCPSSAPYRALSLMHRLFPLVLELENRRRTGERRPRSSKCQAAGAHSSRYPARSGTGSRTHESSRRCESRR